MPTVSDPRLLLLLAVRLRGTIGAADLAAFFELDPAETADRLAALDRDDLLEFRHGGLGGYSLAPDGAALLHRLLADELATAGVRGDIEALYQRFLVINRQVLGVCTKWQLKQGAGAPVANDHDDPDYDGAVIAELARVHEEADALAAALTDVLPRFAPHRHHLQTALDMAVAGDNDYVTKPMFPSYHTTWFELHEDLLATLGRERDDEGSP